MQELKQQEQGAFKEPVEEKPQATEPFKESVFESPLQSAQEPGEKEIEESVAELEKDDELEFQSPLPQEKELSVERKPEESVSDGKELVAGEGLESTPTEEQFSDGLLKSFGETIKEKTGEESAAASNAVPEKKPLPEKPLVESEEETYWDSTGLPEVAKSETEKLVEEGSKEKQQVGIGNKEKKQSESEEKPVEEEINEEPSELEGGEKTAEAEQLSESNALDSHWGEGQSFEDSKESYWEKPAKKSFEGKAVTESKLQIQAESVPFEEQIALKERKPVLSASIPKTTKTGKPLAQQQPSSEEKLFNASIELLKELQVENGACLVTNIGERPLLVYPRDHAFATLAFVSAGLREQARKALEFAFRVQRKDGSFPQRWYVEGSDAGYKPTRVDSIALILFSFAEYVKKFSDVSFAQEHWENIERAIEFIDLRISAEKSLVFSHASIHEFPPIEEGYEIWTNAACFAAFRETAKVAEMLKVRSPVLEKRNVLRDGILSHLWNSRLNSFIKCIKVRESSSVVLAPDASILAIPFFGVLNSENERVKATLAVVESALRHEKIEGIVPATKGFLPGKPFGVSPFFSLVFAFSLIKAGETEKAKRLISSVAGNAFEEKLPELICLREDFEQFVSDLKDAGLLSKSREAMIKFTKSHPLFFKGFARVTEPFSMSHAMFVIAWNELKNAK